VTVGKSRTCATFILRASDPSDRLAGGLFVPVWTDANLCSLKCVQAAALERARPHLPIPLLTTTRQKERAWARETGRRLIVWLILCVRLCGNVVRCGDGEGAACCLDNAVIHLKPPLRSTAEGEWAPASHEIGARWCIVWEHDLVAFAVEHQINDLGHAGQVQKGGPLCSGSGAK